MSQFLRYLSGIFEAFARAEAAIVQKVFYPFLVWCKQRGVSPLFFVGFRLVCLPILYMLFQENIYFWAGILLLLLLISDRVDNSLAKYLNIETDRGHFEDIFSDYLLFGVCMLGLIEMHVAGFGLIAYALFMFPALAVVAILKKHEHSESDWLIKPLPGIAHYLVLFYLFFFGYLFAARNYMDIVLWIMNVLMTIEAFYYFWILQKRWGREN